MFQLHIRIGGKASRSSSPDRIFQCAPAQPPTEFRTLFARRHTTRTMLNGGCCLAGHCARSICSLCLIYVSFAINTVYRANARRRRRRTRVLVPLCLLIIVHRLNWHRVFTIYNSHSLCPRVYTFRGTQLPLRMESRLFRCAVSCALAVPHSLRYRKPVISIVMCLLICPSPLKRMRFYGFTAHHHFFQTERVIEHFFPNSERRPNELRCWLCSTFWQP